MPSAWPGEGTGRPIRRASTRLVSPFLAAAGQSSGGTAAREAKDRKNRTERDTSDQT